MKKGRLNNCKWLIATSEIQDKVHKKVYKKKHWRNVKGEIVNTKNLLNFRGVISGNTMRIYDYNNNLVANLYWS